MALVQPTPARGDQGSWLEMSSFSPVWFLGCPTPYVLLRVVSWPLLMTPRRKPQCFPPWSCHQHLPTAASPPGMLLSQRGPGASLPRAHPFPVPGWQTGLCASANLRMPQEDVSPSPACFPGAQSRLRSEDRLFPNVRGNC